MKIFNQQNYPNVMLVNTPFSIAKYGCLLCSITEYYNWLYKLDTTPDVLMKKLSFDTEGEFIWKSLSNIGLKLVQELNVRNDSIMKKAISSPLDGCIISVHGGRHWMLALGYTSKDYTTADSWTGNKASIVKNYGNDIYGCAIITKQ